MPLLEAKTKPFACSVSAILLLIFAKYCIAANPIRSDSNGYGYGYGEDYVDAKQHLRLRRSNPDSDASSAPHLAQLANLRVLSVTAWTVRVAWDLPVADGCSRIEFQLQSIDHTGLSVNLGGSATAASCHDHSVELPVRPGRAYRLVATVIGPNDQPSFQPTVVNFSSSADGAVPSGLSVWFQFGAVRVAWKPPNGVDVLDYVVSYRALNDGVERRLTSVGVECQLPPLPSRRRFAVRVAARYTAASIGAFTDWLPFYTGPSAAADASAILLTREVSSDEPQQRSGSESASTEALADKLRVKQSDIITLGKLDSILLSWTHPSKDRPEKYVIFYGAQQPKEHRAGEISGDQDHFQIGGLQPEKRYFIAITAIKGIYHFETTIVANTQSLKGDSTHSRQPPQVPMAVKVTQLASRSVAVAWTDPQLGQSGLESERRVYEVEWSLDTADPVPAPEASNWRRNTSELSLRLVGLRPSTAYSVRVRCHAELAPAPSEFSMRAVFSTLAEAPGSPPRDLKVSRSALSVSAMSAVMLSWLPPLEPNGKISKYTVLYRPLDSVEGAGPEHTTTTAETQVVITGLKPATLYYFRVRAENGEGFGPDSNVTMFMMPDSSGHGGGMVYNTDSVLQRDSSSDPDSDGLSSRRWWLLIGGVFGLALLLLATSTAIVCACQQRRPRRSERARTAKESASLIGGPEQQQQQQQPPPPPQSQSSLQPLTGPPGQLAAVSPLSMPPNSTGLLAGHHQLQHHQLQHHQLQLQHQQQQRTPDLCRHADYELRPMDFAACRGGVGAGSAGGGGPGIHQMMLMQPPPPLLMESGPVPNPQLAGHFRNLSNSGGGGTGGSSGYPQHQQLLQGGPRIGAVASPPRVDAPDFSSPGKLSSPHSSLSSSIGSASKQRHAAASAGGIPLMSTSAHSRPYPAPDILNPAPGHRQLQDQQQQQHQHQHHSQLQLRNSHATVGSLTLESQNSGCFALSTEDIDMTKTLDGLIQDIKGLATREFEC